MAGSDRTLADSEKRENMGGKKTQEAKKWEAEIKHGTRKCGGNFQDDQLSWLWSEEM